MIQVIDLLPGITLRCCRVEKFKQGCLSAQFLRPMAAEEAAVNALLPAILLRGTEKKPNLQAITHALDDLYGASVGTLVRRIGDYQAVGLYCGFVEDRFAFQGDAILAPMVALLLELLLEPVTEDGAFCREYVAGEKRNLIAAIESERNDKRAYAAGQMLRKMCAADSFGIPRLGEVAQVEAITPEGAWAHYRRILEESPLELFYVGSAPAETVADLLRSGLSGLRRAPITLPPQTPFRDAGGGEEVQEMEIAQSKLSMGFLTPITNRCPEFAAMQVFNTLFGAGMTSKLFMNVREKMGLCYSIGSGYYGSKGILTVSAGIDGEAEPVVRQEVLNQLAQCQAGAITREEWNAARESVLSALRGAYDSPGAIEGYESTTAISGLRWSVEEYYRAVEALTIADVVNAAKTVRLHTTFFLKGVAK